MMVNHSAVGKKSKRKGASFELETAKNLGAWWGMDFHRVPASGGLHWKGSNNVAGDIVAPLEAQFPFVVECKKREEWTIENLLLNNKDIKNWWGQVVGDANETGKVPLLIFTRNRAKSFVMLPYHKDMIDILEEGEFPLMVSNVTFKDTMGDTHTYKVITTVLDGLTSITPSSIRAFFDSENYNWVTSLVKETKTVETAQALDADESINTLLNSVEGE